MKHECVYNGLRKCNLLFKKQFLNNKCIKKLFMYFFMYKKN